MMKDYYQKSMRALQLAGMSERTVSALGSIRFAFIDRYALYPRRGY